MMEHFIACSEPSRCVLEEHAKHITMHVVSQKKIYSNNFEANASELLENIGRNIFSKSNLSLCIHHTGLCEHIEKSCLEE